MKVKSKKSVSKADQKNEPGSGKCLKCESCAEFTASSEPEICQCGHPTGEHEKARQMFGFTLTVSLKSGHTLSMRKDDQACELQIERDFAAFLSSSSDAPKFGQFDGYPTDGTNRVKVSLVIPFAEVSALSVTRKDAIRKC